MQRSRQILIAPYNQQREAANIDADNILSLSAALGP
jgi:hypothetical protein